MNKSTLKILLGLLAFALAGCAAFFSITGLSMLFAGASLSVIVMSSCLEAAKLVAASFLYQFWKTISKLLKFYLVIAVIILAAITSLGIYGFLSNAYQQTKIAYNLSKTTVDSLATQKSSYEFRVNNLQQQVDFKKGQLQSFTNSSANRDNLLTTLASQNKNVGSVERNAARTQKEISKINTEISTIMDQIRPLQDSVFYYDVAIKKASLNTSQKSELGPLEYLSGVLHTDMDKIVNWFILLFVLVFDPLAMALLISFNFLSKKPKLEEKEVIKKEEPVVKEEPKKNLIDDIPIQIEVENFINKEVTSSIKDFVIESIILNHDLNKIENIFTESIVGNLYVTESIETKSFITQTAVLDDRIELPKEEVITISEEENKSVIQKDTAVIEYVPLTGDSIYEESNEIKAAKEMQLQPEISNIKPGIQKRIGYTGGVS